MRKITFFLSLLAINAAAFADSFMLDNQTSYPGKSQKSKIMIQWANSSKEVDDDNKALMYGNKMDTTRMQVIAQSGKITLDAPVDAQYFRVLVWSKNDATTPDLHTNWVDVVPNKTYTLKNDQLIPSVLMSGTGC